jgi:hypothetical protein
LVRIAHAPHDRRALSDGGAHDDAARKLLNILPSTNTTVDANMTERGPAVVNQPTVIFQSTSSQWMERTVVDCVKRMWLCRTASSLHLWPDYCTYCLAVSYFRLDAPTQTRSFVCISLLLDQFLHLRPC